MTVRLGDEAPNFTAETSEGTISFIFAPARLHAGLHDRAWSDGET
jgi:hypothetical protein